MTDEARHARLLPDFDAHDARGAKAAQSAPAARCFLAPAPPTAPAPRQTMPDGRPLVASCTYLDMHTYMAQLRGASPRIALLPCPPQAHARRAPPLGRCPVESCAAVAPLPVRRAMQPSPPPPVSRAAPDSSWSRLVPTPLQRTWDGGPCRSNAPWTRPPRKQNAP